MDHITVCICTYKRTALLKRLLISLQEQVTDGLFTYSIVVVDNDYAQSARSLAESINQKSSLSIRYYSEPRKNIALARNKAVENSKGNLIAFIDDDEFPHTHWLLNLYRTLYETGADGVLGPVKPHFDNKPPDWLIKGKFCERPDHQTGTVLHWDDTRTGNVLVNSSVFEDSNNRFPEAFGETGGEDIQFFEKLIKKGRTLVWCSEAIVYEAVPPERWRKMFYIRKFSRIGGLNGELCSRDPLASSKIKYCLKAVTALVFYVFCLPFSVPVAEHMFVKCLTKIAYHFSWLLGFCGHSPIRNKDT